MRARCRVWRWPLRRMRRNGQRQTLHLARINGLPGLLRCIDGELESVQTLLVEDGLIRRIYTLRNPDKLSCVPVPPQALP